MNCRVVVLPEGLEDQEVCSKVVTVDHKALNQQWTSPRGKPSLTYPSMRTKGSESSLLVEEKVSAIFCQVKQLVMTRDK
jgi:hypothetical protein